MWPLFLLGIIGVVSAGIPGTNGDIRQPNFQKELMDEAKVCSSLSSFKSEEVILPFAFIFSLILRSPGKCLQKRNKIK